jgi:nucleoside-diphosphate-sugar epimerase
VRAAGGEVVEGDLTDLDGLARAAREADAVVHLAFRHDLMQVGDMAGAADADLRALEAMADALAGSDKPLVSTSGTVMCALFGVTGRECTEDDAFASGYRVDAENLVVGLAGRGVRSSVVRLPPTVHSDLDTHGFVPSLIATARTAGFSGYPGDGANRWPAVHTLDAVGCYRLALEAAPAGARLHAAAESGVALREIATVIGEQLGLPVRSVDPSEVAEHFAHLAFVVGVDNPTSSAQTRQVLGWQPTEAGLLDDLRAGHYFASA